MRVNAGRATVGVTAAYMTIHMAIHAVAAVATVPTVVVFVVTATVTVVRRAHLHDLRARAIAAAWFIVTWRAYGIWVSLAFVRGGLAAGSLS